MKKLLTLLLALTMALSLGACGGDAPTTPPPTTTPTPPAAGAPVDPVADEQAKADADYAQIHVFIEQLNDHIALANKSKVVVDNYKAGGATGDEVIACLLELADDSGRMIGEIEAAAWQTAHYAKHIEALTACVGSLAAAEELSYQSAAQDDESKLEQVPTFLDTYDQQLTVLLDLIGA